ncbi:sulfatase [Salegentibacter salegens]|uniref:Arylsulfatase A n=1 Tax=Salegentibacter salegens TaxID=143223 RepID=A0A1M7IIL7_9FLAO|nr:sulfatase [Salegentibacter salegens]PRX40404.1 arylsulfatase A-like enzyme [Salegentibacter salegens]SHM40652.1 Arylsulfatase A [Salegentibacter salegens]
MNFFKLILYLFLLQTFSVIGQTKKPPNVLFLFVDDLRPDLGCYGNEIIKSPNIDQLASEGSVFLKHYVQVPTCGASRYSILTGQLPSAKGELSNQAIRELISGQPEQAKPETFIHQLRRKGYYTVGMGKIGHYIDGLYGYNESSEGAKRELPYSWDEKVFNAGKWGNGWNAFFGYADGSNRQSRNKQVKPYEKGDVGDEGYPDGLTANLAVEKLGELAKKEQPFFLGVGFFKPHLPFTSPKKYWDLYDESDIETTKSPNIPENINVASLHNNGELNQYLLGEEKPTLDNPASEEYAQKLRRAYYAAVSYTDAQVGKILNELKKQGLAENTIVILWGDHGWQLGDHREWGKHTIFEKAVRSPLIIKAPNLPDQTPRVDKIVSSIDIYPTLMELCDLEMPYKTAGRSMVRLLDKNRNKDWQQNAYSYYKDGISVRVPRYRYTKYFRTDKPRIELYDHKNDPYENDNVAEEHPQIVKKLDKILEMGNTGLYEK